jgi:hypothetical protein
MPRKIEVFKPYSRTYRFSLRIPIPASINTASVPLLKYEQLPLLPLPKHTNCSISFIILAQSYKFFLIQHPFQGLKQVNESLNITNFTLISLLLSKKMVNFANIHRKAEIPQLH